MVVLNCNPSYSRGRGRGILEFEVNQGKVSETPYLKNKLHMKGLRAWFKW
jgi:hypothetical protein